MNHQRLSLSLWIFYVASLCKKYLYCGKSVIFTCLVFFVANTNLSLPPPHTHTNISHTNLTSPPFFFNWLIFYQCLAKIILYVFRFFGDVVLPPSDKPIVKIPSKLKEALREAKASMDKRLKEEQKVVRKLHLPFLIILSKGLIICSIYFWAHTPGCRRTWCCPLGKCAEMVYSIMPPLMTLTLWSVYYLFYYVVWFGFMPINVTFVCQFLAMDSEND